VYKQGVFFTSSKSSKPMKLLNFPYQLKIVEN